MTQNIDQKNLSEPNPLEDGSHILTLLRTYLSDHLETGFLVFQVIQKTPSEGLIPVPNAKVTLSKDLGDGYSFSRVYPTNSDGKTEAIPLPTIATTPSDAFDENRMYSIYEALIEAPGFLPQKVIDIPIFQDITTLQPVDLLPNPNLIAPPSTKKNNQS